ncbi:MAG TPA: hypothetical protein VFF64_09700 [Candidatus Eremiobacteraceae bacterium]|nr:hypothetical protein [Candidatus Eremiobacteraceae bacterium]
MDGFMTVGPTGQVRGHVAIDMGWRTALVLALFFGFCLLATGISLWRIFTGAPVGVRITWQTGLLLLAALWFALKVEDRAAQFGAVLLVLSSGSRILLAVLGASAPVQSFNALIMRAVNAVVLTGFCFYGGYWFKQRIRRI